MTTLRLIAWNCHHGTPNTRLAELAALAPAIVFLQEVTPSEALPSFGQRLIHRVGSRKGIVLASLHADYHLEELKRRANRGRAVLGATVSGPASFIALGIWSQGPRYVDDVMRTLTAYRNVLRSGPAVVMGDLNSGSNLNLKQSPSQGHSRILATLAELGLVSAYHAFYRVEHGHETHPTYRHQRNPSKPWHIDFCFVPKRWTVLDVDLIDGEDWMTSDHLPLKVDLRLTPG